MARIVRRVNTPLTQPPSGPRARDARPAPARSALDGFEGPRAAHRELTLDVSRDLGPALQLAGVSIERLAPACAPANVIGRQTMRLIFDLLMSEELVMLAPGKTKPGEEVPFWRRAESAAAALSQPLPPETAGQTPLGKCAILRPGVGNLAPSPGFAFRAARMADKVVLAYTNMTEPESRALRAVDEVGGIPVPPELKGKILAIGSPEHELVSYAQASDIFLEQLEQLRRQQDLLGFDPLEGEATVVAHSQGGLESVLSRKRLEAAGFPHAIGRLVTVDSPFGGSTAAEKVLGALLGAVGVASDPTDGLAAVRELSPEATARWFPKEDQRWVDLAVVGSIGGRPRIRPRLGFPPFRLEDPDNIRPLMRMAATMARGASLFTTPGDFLERLRRPVQDDGLVSVQSASYGREVLSLSRPYDHMGVWEDYRVLDDAAVALAAAPAEDAERRSA